MFAIVYNHANPALQPEPTIYAGFGEAETARTRAAPDYPTMALALLPQPGLGWLIEALDEETGRTVGLLHEAPDAA